jgi:ABC-type transporter Mla subunit MlaD
MALQDLTPQLRTRLSRMERAVGWFVLLAAGLLAFGFIYYVYNTAERKGWFKIKAPYFTFTSAATGLKAGDPVRLMGLDVGQITKMEPMPPDQFEYNIYVEFEIKQPYYGYLWTEGSRARVATADFLGKRVLEVAKGTGGYPRYILRPLREVPIEEIQNLPGWQQWLLGEDVYDRTITKVILHALTPLSTNLPALTSLGLKHLRVVDGRKETKQKAITGVWNDKEGRYEPFFKTNMYWLVSDESPAVTERLENLVSEVEKALPNILTLTNQLANVLSNSASLTSNLNIVAVNAQPAVSNLARATAHLDRPGALGEWLIPTNISRQLEGTLGSANTTLTSATTNLTELVSNLSRSLDNLANITSNLNSQVQANNNILTQVSRTIINADDLMQGLKRHWLFRSAFKNKPTTPPPEPEPPVRAPKQSK